MVSAKLKQMKGTIPRNELSAIMLMTVVAFIVRKAFGDRVGEIIYVHHGLYHCTVLGAQ